MRDIPVFFIHIGNANYVKTTIKQAKKYNNRVILIGDNSNKTYCEEWYNIYDYYGNEYDLLKKRYVHMSTNSETFEFSAIAKFLALYNLAKEKNVSELMLLDSDLMTYVNYSQLDWNGIDAGFSVPEYQEPYIWTVSVHCSYWSIEALQSFVKYLLEVYDKKMNSLEEKWNYDQINKRPGGICDMTLVYLWYKEHPEMNFFNTSKITNGLVFDHFLFSTEGFRVGDFKINKYLEMKILKFKNGIPYFKYKDNTWVRACTIHAQGGRKRYINLLYENETSKLSYYFLKIHSDRIRIRNRLIKVLKR